MTNQQKLLNLLEQSGMTRAKAAEIIKEATRGAAGSWRTIQSWLADPEKTKHPRPCPDWAIEILENWVKEHPQG